MSVNPQEWQEEQLYLQQVIDFVNQELVRGQQEAKSQETDIIELRTSMWEDLPRRIRQWEDLIELFTVNRDMDVKTQTYLATKRRLEFLRRAQSTPYFARIDFRAKEDDELINVYIGYGTLGDYTSDKLLVYDWRSPIAGMFYDFELGEAHYDSYDGPVEGTILLKRQYRIREGQLEYMFDSALNIADEVLQQVLSRSADDKMKNIVATIQREQNAAIRDARSRLLVVQGAAGSGKTSIALHRAAYLLYKHRNSLRAHNILIFSPNQIFTDYISAVLPELGEENVLHTTFQEYIEESLGSSFEVQSLNDQMEVVITNKDQDRYDLDLAEIEYKASSEFITLLRNYAAHFAETGVGFADVVFAGKVLFSGSELDRMYTSDYSFLPAKARLEKIWRRIVYKLKPLKRQRFEAIRRTLAADPPRVFVSERDLVRESVAQLRQELKTALGPTRQRIAWDIVEFYTALFKDEELYAQFAGSKPPAELKEVFQLTLTRIESGFLSYGDAMALLYLKAVLEGVRELGEIRHLIVDEAQDYSLLHYEVMRKLFPRCKITLLGDLNQSIYPYSRITDYDAVAQTLGIGGITHITLSKSYRSTKDIIEFTKGILPTGEAIQAIDRAGHKPQLVKVPTERREQVKIIAQDLVERRDSGAESIAVICRSAHDSRQVHLLLTEELLDTPVTLISDDDDRLRPGIVVIPSYLAKGLEFVSVLVLVAEHYAEPERKLFYTVCTRAQHHLQIYFADRLPPLLQEVSTDLYQMRE